MLTMQAEHFKVDRMSLFLENKITNWYMNLMRSQLPYDCQLCSEEDISDGTKQDQ